VGFGQRIETELVDDRSIIRPFVLVTQRDATAASGANDGDDELTHSFGVDVLLLGRFREERVSEYVRSGWFEPRS